MVYPKIYILVFVDYLTADVTKVFKIEPSSTPISKYQFYAVGYSSSSSIGTPGDTVIAYTASYSIP
jgi:hypothetical protein